MKEVFQGPRGRILNVPDELAQAWAVASAKPSRSKREIDVLRWWMERQAHETIQLHILLTAMTRKCADAFGRVSFPIAELVTLQDPKRLVSVSSSNEIGEVSVQLPAGAEPLISPPGAFKLPPPPSPMRSTHR